ncbi:unnamed protein product, partial [marine sediment metagenome]
MDDTHKILAELIEQLFSMAPTNAQEIAIKIAANKIKAQQWERNLVEEAIESVR